MRSDSEGPPADRTPLRRMPSQRRSREKVERILESAAALIAEVGSDALRMSELARLAGIPIGSLYQYFPDKSAVIQALTERYGAQCRACIAEALDATGSLDQLCDAYDDLIDIYYGLFLAEPVMRDIWSGTQADKTLRAIVLADSRANAAVLAAAIGRLRPPIDAAELDARALLLFELGEATMRLAIAVGYEGKDCQEGDRQEGDRQEGDRLVAAYKRMARAELRRCVEDG